MTPPLRVVGRRLLWTCHVCGHPVAAMSEAAIQAAMDAHAAFVNQTKDRATDEHFADLRLDALIER